jgi:hypothetical protein
MLQMTVFQVRQSSSTLQVFQVFQVFQLAVFVDFQVFSRLSGFLAFPRPNIYKFGLSRNIRLPGIAGF